MLFCQKVENSFYLSNQDVKDFGLSILPSHQNYEKQEYHYSIDWICGEDKPIIKSKSGQKIIGDGWNTLSKISVENQNTLERFVIGFHILNGVFITKYHQFGDELKVTVKEFDKTVSLDELDDSHFKKEDIFHLQKPIYEEGYWRNGVYPSFHTKRRRLKLPYSLWEKKNIVVRKNHVHSEDFTNQLIDNLLERKREEEVERTRKRFEELGIKDLEVRGNR